ncbi:MAG: sensor histidine kinase [Acidobacteriota bacterium]
MTIIGIGLRVTGRRCPEELRQQVQWDPLTERRDGMEFQLFTRTFDNRFIFSLFELLLSGIVVVIFLKSWKQKSVRRYSGDFLPASLLLSGSLAYLVFWTGAQFLLRLDLYGLPLSFASHLCLAGSCLLFGIRLSAKAGKRPRRHWKLSLWVLASSVAPLVFASSLPHIEPLVRLATRVLDWAALLILTGLIVILLRRPSRWGRIWTAGIFFLWLSVALHLGSGEQVVFPISHGELLCWNLEHFCFSAALLLLALAIGEMNTKLFDIVFIRVQLVFILLASLSILMVTRTERTEYLEQLRQRTADLATFLAAGVEASHQSGPSLSAALQRQDLLTRIVLDFGNVPEMAAIHLVAEPEAAIFEINPEGKIQTSWFRASPDPPVRFADQDHYFLIGVFPVEGSSSMDRVAFFGAKESINQFTRRRTAVIFILFTGAVALATLAFGFVVQNAERTLARQADEIRSKQEELVMASKLALLGEMAGSVAHEVNNPATTIMTRASFLLKQGARRGLSESDQADLKAILEQAHRIARITGSLLGFSRKHVFEIGPVPICQVIEKSLQLVGQDLRSRAIEVSIQGCPAPYPVAGDRNALVQVFVNLLRNSIDAMPGGGKLAIEISCSRLDLPLRIGLSDTGRGIEPSQLSQVFVPFFTTKPLGKGTGLGLSVVHGIIAEHKGSIRVRSGESGGTTFIIELPCWREDG